jgi:hypothetical protein
VLIRAAELDAIRSGDLDLAFRRWDRARLRAGTRMRTPIGLVEATSVDQVTLESVTDADARRAGAGSRRDLLHQLAADPGRPVFRIGLRYAGPDPRISLRERTHLTAAERAELIDRLARLDRASRHGAWTRATLEVIDRLPATRAADLARELDRDTLTFKRDVRRLKELGLTESLGTGYRLAPRARALIESL